MKKTGHKCPGQMVKGNRKEYLLCEIFPSRKLEKDATQKNCFHEIKWEDFVSDSRTNSFLMR